MQVGVGNSKLQIDMAIDGYTCITSIDYSEVVIEQMQHSSAQQPQLQYAVADARSIISCAAADDTSATACHQTLTADTMQICSAG